MPYVFNIFTGTLDYYKTSGGSVTPGGNPSQLQYNGTGVFSGAPIDYISDLRGLGEILKLEDVVSGSAPNFVIKGSATSDAALGGNITLIPGTGGNANGLFEVLQADGSAGFALNQYTSPGYFFTYNMPFGNGTLALTTDLPTFVDNEVPAGTIDDSNVTFNLAFVPIANSEHIFVNGARLSPSNDYTISSATITLKIPVGTNGNILVDYRK
jgi:hypothetical protein